MRIGTETSRRSSTNRNTIGFTKRTSRNGLSAAILILLLAIFAGVACNDGRIDVIRPTGPFDLTFSLDASFQSVHGGQPIHWAVVRSFDSLKVAEGSGMLSTTADPCFSLTARDVLMEGLSYEVHYWIDSNIGGGAVGVCDPKAIDHQWSTEFFFPSNDISFTVPYSLWLIEDVCGTFRP